MKKLLFITLIVFSCGEQIPQPSGYIAEGLQDYVFSFYTYGVENGYDIDLSDVDIVFDETPGRNHGWYSFDQKRITFDPDFYARNKDNHWLMERVVWHELGHYFLGRDHIQYTIGMVPVSVMSTQWFLCPENYRSYYLFELFNGSDI